MAVESVDEIILPENAPIFRMASWAINAPDTVSCPPKYEQEVVEAVKAEAAATVISDETSAHPNPSNHTLNPYCPVLKL